MQPQTRPETHEPRVSTKLWAVPTDPVARMEQGDFEASTVTHCLHRTFTFMAVLPGWHRPLLPKRHFLEASA